GSNRHELLHWCLRPARLPIPPSGLAYRILNLAEHLGAHHRVTCHGEQPTLCDTFIDQSGVQM
ncbi:MAG: hypothetical protein RSE22_04275, partial [Mucinivorans sp.]